MKHGITLINLVISFIVVTCAYILIASQNWKIALGVFIINWTINTNMSSRIKEVRRKM